MPMPKLLKKLSRKSLRDAGSESDAETDSSSHAPPLPTSEYYERDEEPRNMVFVPPYARPRSRSSSATSGDSPARGDWTPTSVRSSPSGTATGSRPSTPNTSPSDSHSRQGSSVTFDPRTGKVYAPPAGPPPPTTGRKRTMSSLSTTSGSRPVSYAISENDSRPPSRTLSRVYSPPPGPPGPSNLGLAVMTPPTQVPAPMRPPPPPPPAQAIPPDDDLSKSLAGAWQVANTGPKQSKFDKTLQAAEGSMMKGMVQEGKGMAFVAGVETALTVVGGMDVIENGIHSLVEGLPALFNALDEVAKIHPFIGVAVLAFKAVWSLEQKRRENDKLILSLHVEMRDMMAVLTQLKNVKDAEEIAPDGTSIKGRMQEVIKNTAEDIKGCANACDTYTKKRTVVKVLKSGVWAGKLTGFVATFTKRRGEFEFALSIHTALGVDAANRALSAVDKTTQEMNAKMDMMMKMFSQMMSPEAREMARLVEQRGGAEACQDNDKLLKELNELEAKSSSSLGPQSSKGSASANGAKSALEDLRDELSMDLDAAMEKNMTAFSRKFEVQQRQIIDELTKVVERQGDRIISALSSGPHDRLLDPDVYKIWKDMGWRGSVKARYFVMSLRDYYQEGGIGDNASPVGEGETKEPPTPAPRNIADDWALQYLSVSRLQSISEALDDDASGFVTIAEANAFTAARPLDWSLTKWLALWAVGWHQSMTRYAIKIRELIAKMFAVRFNVLPSNRVAVNKYLDDIYRGVTTLHSGLNPCYINESLQEKFSQYFDAEEERLRGNLEAIQYDVDALNTLFLITGHGRIERFIMPLLYLFLSRDFQILRACISKPVHPDELWDSSDTIGWLVLAAKQRVDLLEATFKQQKVDVKQQFKSFSHGLFQYMHDPEGLWDPKLILAQDEADYPYDDSLEAHDVDLSKILNYPLEKEHLDVEAYNPPAKAKKPATKPSAALRTLLGTWNGFTYSPGASVVPSSGMISMDLVGTGAQTFAATSRANMSDFTIAGECTQQNVDIINFKFKQSFPTRYATLYFSGSWHNDTQSLTGTWGEESDARTHPGVFLFKRTQPECMTFFPAPAELNVNTSRALWKYAIQAIRYGVRRNHWSWLFFEERATRRKRFTELYIRDTRFGRPLSRVEKDELGLLKKSFTVADSRFFHSIAEREIRHTTDHDVFCDACKGHIGGTRVTCLTCRLEGTFDTVDFCNTLACTSAKVIPTGLTKPHLPGHDVLKVRRVVHIRNFGRTYRDAQAAYKRSREFFPDPDDPHPHRVVKRPPECRVCRRAVDGNKCWFCVHCEEPSFICNSCEARPKIAFGNHNMDLHDLVRSQPPLAEEHEADLGERFDKHQEHIDHKLQELEDRVAARFSSVDERLADMERMLKMLVSALGSGSGGAIRLSGADVLPAASADVPASPPRPAPAPAKPKATYTDPYMYP
ncbi:hypothetical protein HMN09_01159800 [Mycena chlorophos]|uniref:Uncharacterized protein n=1 Tax=Mycena chlorophos TaxID=658473 RepID=A0A8H6S8K2_MYCCL|nr:hypothetical protein HMN09_01159800 [Mycena chlorophos]